MNTEIAIDEERLVAFAARAIETPSFTGSERAMGELMAVSLAELGMDVSWQEVEDGRANVLATWPGAGGGASLMFNGHMDTSYSGAEPWLAGVAGFQPHAFVKEGRLFGLGISNMKGALACYVEAVAALRDAGVRLRGDLIVAAVVGEIEKAQWGEARGSMYRGYGAGTRHLVVHGGVADMCILGEPTESKLVLAHFGSLWLRISTRGEFVHTAFSGGRDRNAIVRLAELLGPVGEWCARWEAAPDNACDGVAAIVNLGAVQGGHPWRLSRTPHRADLFLDVRVPPSKSMAHARGEALDLVRALAERYPDHGVEGEVYVTAPGAQIDPDHPLVAAIAAAHGEVFGSEPERAVTRWYSDASALVRAGVPTINYGTSTGLLDTTDGENLDISGLVATARVYALAAMRLCGVAG